MPRSIIFPPPRTPDPLFDDVIQSRLVSLMRRVQRRGVRPTYLQQVLMVQQLKAIDPRLEPLVDDVVNGSDAADGCIAVLMDLVGPEVAVGAALVFKMLGARSEHVALAWSLAEQKTIEVPGKGSAAEIRELMLGYSAGECETR